MKRAVEDALKTRAEGAPVDSGAIGTAVATALAERFKDLPTAESVQASIDSALKARDEAEEARQKAETERAEAEAKAKEDREQAEKDAETRADLLMTVKPLLPEGTEVRGKSNHELLVLAAGDEVPGAKDRSEDYLLAKIEDIAKRREAANGGPAPAPNGGGTAERPASTAGRASASRARSTSVRHSAPPSGGPKPWHRLSNKISTSIRLAAFRACLPSPPRCA